MVHGFNDENKEKVEVIAGNVIRVKLEDSVPANSAKTLTWQYNLTENGYSKVDVLSYYQRLKTSGEYFYGGYIANYNYVFPNISITYTSNPDNEMLVNVSINVFNNSSSTANFEGGFSLILLP